MDPAGNLYIGDDGSHLRKVSPDGIISTLAGNGQNWYSGDGGLATKAQLSGGDIALDNIGNLYIADRDNYRIRKVSGAGIITTIAGVGCASCIADGGGYSGDGGLATNAQINFPQGVAADSAGNVYIGDSGNNRVRKVSPEGIITTIAGTGNAGYAGDGGPATSAQLNSPQSLALDGGGNIYFSDNRNNVVRRISPLGAISTVAGNGTQGFSGDGGLATQAQLSSPQGIALDGGGNLYIADEANDRVRVVSTSGMIATVAGNGTQAYSGDGGLAVNAALNFPYAVAVNAAGNLFIADYSNFRVREVSASGIITTIAGDSSGDYSGDGGLSTAAGVEGPFGLAMNASGNVYVAHFYAVRLLQTLSTLAITTPPTLPQGSVGSSYSQTLAATGGLGPYAWSLVSGNLPAGLTLSTAGLITGTPTAPGGSLFTVQVTDTTSTSATQAFSLIIVPAGNGGSPSINPGGVVSAADYVAPVAPGSIASAFGNFLLSSGVGATQSPLPTDISGLSLQFGGGRLAPLFFVSGGQVNFQVPWELSGQSQSTLTATLNNVSGAAQTMALAPFAPAIFSMNAQGSGQGAILDTSYRLVDSSNPTTANAFVLIYCTGLGAVTNQPATGSPGPSNPLAWSSTPTVTIGGVPAAVSFSGLAPGYVGLYQVNTQVPAGLAPNSAVPVIISIGGVTSNTVTMAVQ